MRTLIYKSGFLRYFASLLEYCQPGKRKGSYLGAFALITFFTFGLNVTSWTWGSALILLWIAVYLSGLRNAKPNVVTLAPLSYKQKLIYSWLAPALYFVLSLATMIIIRVLSLCVVSVYGLLIGANVAPVWEYSFMFDPLNPVTGEMGVYGMLFGLIFQLACYSAGMFYSSIKKGTFKALFVFIYCVAIYLCLQFMSLSYSLTLVKEWQFFGFFIGTPFQRTCYEFMQLPWLSILLCGVAALAFFGVTVWFSARRTKGKDY